MLHRTGNWHNARRNTQPIALADAGRHARAAAALGVATDIAPDRSDVWYNLACARARAGNPRGALDALETAVERGYADAEHLAADPDLESLRQDDRFCAILDGIRRCS